MVLIIESLLPVSDVLFLNCSSTTETINPLYAEQNALLPDGANIVNTARGVLIAERALADALTSGKLASAGLDVYQTEP
jgi:phosphoglycerate dehydrogenase-like enzyme